MRSVRKRVGVALAGALLASAAVAVPASAEPAGLTGTVVDDATGAPVQACVTVYDTTYSWVDQACTDESGTWTTTTTEAGVDYKVEIQPSDGLHLPEWFDDAADFDGAAVVTAPSSLSTRVTEGAVLTGTLTDAGGSGVDDAQVSLWPVGASAPSTYAYVWAGSWRALVVPGDYQVEFAKAPSGSGRRAPPPAQRRRRSPRPRGPRRSSTTRSRSRSRSRCVAP